jgi:hypothetical protein
MSLSHRGYRIEQIRGAYVAQSSDGDDSLQFTSRQMHRVLDAINALWLTTLQIRSRDFEPDELVSPRWLREWLKCPTDTIDLDAAYSRGAC